MLQGIYLQGTKTIWVNRWIMHTHSSILQTCRLLTNKLARKNNLWLAIGATDEWRSQNKTTSDFWRNNKQLKGDSSILIRWNSVHSANCSLPYDTLNIWNWFNVTPAIYNDYSERLKTGRFDDLPEPSPIPVNGWVVKLFQPMNNGDSLLVP